MVTSNDCSGKVDPLQGVTQDASCQPDDETSFRLLVAVRGGYPLDDVLALLELGDLRLVRIAAWVVSELGTLGCTLGDRLVALLQHEDPHVRAWGCDSAIACSLTLNSSVFAAASSLLLDDVNFVRVDAVHLLAVAPEQLIAEAIPEIKSERVRQSCQWLLNVGKGKSPQGVLPRAVSPELLDALVAVAAAGRVDASGEMIRRILEATTDEHVESAAKHLLLVRSSW